MFKLILALVFCVSLSANDSDTQFMKGYVVKETQKDGRWHYEIKSEESENLKLTSATFSSTKKLFDKDDLVYLKLKSMRLVEYYVITKGNIKRVEKKTTPKDMTNKVAKKESKRPRELLRETQNTPQEEMIILK